MHKKQFYEAPDAELLVVKFEENFCGTTDGIPNFGTNDVVDDSDDWTQS